MNTLEIAKRLMAAEEQRVIRERISAMQTADPSLTFASAWDRLKSASPELFDRVDGAQSAPSLPGNGGTPVDDSEAIRQRKILGLVEKVLQTRPGITFKTAHLTVQHQNPELFPEMENLGVKEKNMARQEKIKAAVEELRLRMPHLNFAAAWHKLQREKPELFEFESA
jgi:hypothetical protein